jgi:hypothetical protein
MRSTEFEDMYYTATDVQGVNDAYSRLMAKERRVLDTVNSVVEQRRKELEYETKAPAVNMSLQNVLRRTARTIELILTDLIEGRSIEEIFVTKRLMYVGVMLCLVSFLLILLTQSDK